jgi:hypothetical protein
MYRIQVHISGLRPLLFDRYAGDNNTTLPVEEKMYLTEAGQLIIPALNVFSMLCGENTKSVARQFWGRKGKTVALGISAYCDIKPYEIPILDEGEPIFFTGFNGKIEVVEHVARLARGIPNPKVRPQLNLPWSADFEIEYQRNEYCTLEMLRQSVQMAGTIGLGTFRPFYGRFVTSVFDVEEI